MTDATLETYVQAFSGNGKVGLTGPRLQVSDGGMGPVWRADGKELYYFNHRARKVMAVTLEYEPRLAAGPPRELFAADLVQTLTHKDALNDGSRLLLVRKSTVPTIPARMTVMTNWQARAASAGRSPLSLRRRRPRTPPWT